MLQVYAVYQTCVLIAICTISLLFLYRTLQPCTAHIFLVPHITMTAIEQHSTFHSLLLTELLFHCMFLCDIIGDCVS